MSLLENRRDNVESCLKSLQEKIKKADELAKGKACVYLTGSFGRGEASAHSDLDLFIVGLGTKAIRELTNLDEILMKATLIEATREQGFPEFSGDGEYLTHYTMDDLVGTLGTRDDDKINTFTARLLLLLESRPLLEDEIYSEVISEVIAAYWEDYKGHETEFMPAFLVNDILRLWRTFCVNYEARTRNLKEIEELKAKRKLMSYKLKHSRLLTCYSAIVYLMAIMAERDTVSEEDAKKMVYLTPLERLEWLRNQSKFEVLSDKVDLIIDSYSTFLEKTDIPKDKLIEKFMDPKESTRARWEAKEFGDKVHSLLCEMGKDNRLFRILVV